MCIRDRCIQQASSYVSSSSFRLGLLNFRLVCQDRYVSLEVLSHAFKDFYYPELQHLFILVKIFMKISLMISLNVLSFLISLMTLKTWTISRTLTTLMKKMKIMTLQFLSSKPPLPIITSPLIPLIISSLITPTLILTSPKEAKTTND